MNRIMRVLWNNLSSIILALLLAVAVWVAATLQNDPFDVRRFAAVPVTPLNQPQNTVFFEGDPAWIAVDARAQQTVLDTLKVSDFVAQMDLSAVEPGITVSVPVSVTTSVELVRIESYEPAAQTVHLEALGSDSIPVEIQTEGQVATGYYASNQIVVTPEQVTVRGPEPYIAEIALAVGSVSVEGANTNVIESVPIMLRDANGDLVTGVEWDPQQVEVSVPVLRRVGYKPEVLVVPDVRGDPEEGYRRGSVAVVPSTVTLAGPPLVLNDLPSFVRTEAITITGMTEVLTERIPLSMPTNIVAVGVNYVTVTISILPVVSSRAMTSTVGVQGLTEGYEAILSPDMVDVILVGPDTVLAELGPEDIQVFVNLFDLALGVHRVDPIVLYPENIDLESVLPSTIEVTIQLQATPAPLTSTLSTDDTPP
jgi:YbbR domain-containing protein